MLTTRRNDRNDMVHRSDHGRALRHTPYVDVTWPDSFADDIQLKIGEPPLRNINT